MPVTRFYLPSSGTPAVSPPISATTWPAHRNPVSRPTSTTTSGTPIADTVYAPDATDHLTVGMSHCAQFVSAPINPMSFTGMQATIQVRALEADTNNNLFLAWTAYVTSLDGTSVLCTPVPLQIDDTEFSGATATNRGNSASCDPVSFVGQAGRLVIEIGWSGTPSDSTGVQGHNATLSFGDDAGTDLPGSVSSPDDSATVANNPWVEFEFGTVTYASVLTAGTTLSAGAPVIAAPLFNWNQPIAVGSVFASSSVLDAVPAFGISVIVIAMSASPVGAGSPVIGVQAIGQVQAMTAPATAAGQPAIAAATLNSTSQPLTAPSNWAASAAVLDAIPAFGINAILPANLVAGHPALGAAAFVQVSLFSVAAAHVTPSFGSPDIAAGGLSATGMTGGMPVIAAATFHERNGLTATGAVDSAGTMGAPAFNQAAALAAATPAPHPAFGALSLGQIHYLAQPAGITVQGAAWGTASIQQDNGLAAGSVVSQAAAMPAPVLFQGQALLAAVWTSAPAIDAPGIGQVHKLAATFAGATPLLGSPAIGQHQVLAPQDLTIGGFSYSPVVGAVPPDMAALPVIPGPPIIPALTLHQIHALAAVPLAVLAPEVPELLPLPVSHMTASGAATGVPASDRPAIGQVHQVTVVSLTAGSPPAAKPVLHQQQAFAVERFEVTAPVIGAAQAIATVGNMMPEGLAIAAPVIDAFALLQRHLLTAHGQTVTIALPASRFSQRGIMAAADLDVSSPTFGDPDYALRVFDLAAGAMEVTSITPAHTHFQFPAGDQTSIEYISGRG